MVADAPRLRPDLVIRRIPGPEDVSYVVKDPVTRKYLRFPEAAGRLLAHLDGETPLSMLPQRLTRAGLAPPSLEALEGFIQQLRAMDLLELSPAERMEHQLERLRSERRLRVRSRNAFGSILHARFSVWDPDRWMDRVVPRLRFFWTPAFFLLSLAAILVATAIIYANWGRFQSELHQLFSGQAGWQKYLLFLVISLVVITIHELGHGLTCKHFGGHVHEIGFLLMYFMPCFYCNVNDAWLFARRSERLWVTVAGGYIELFVGALATFAWWLTRAGHPVNEVAFQAALVASVGSVAVNLNPLIKLDGYYGLSDYLGIPNLRENAFRYVRAFFQRQLLRRAVPVPEVSPRRRKILLTYGLLAGAYSMTILVLFARRAFEFFVTRSGDWGVVFFLGLMAYLVVIPAWRRSRRPTTDDRPPTTDGGGERRPSSVRDGSDGSRMADEAGRMTPSRWRRWSVVGRRSSVVGGRSSFVVLALLFLALVPRWSMPVRLRCVLEPGRQAVLYAPEDARVVEVRCEEGERVEAGQPVLQLEAAALSTELARARLQLAISRERVREAQLAGDLAAWQAERRRANAQKADLRALEKRAVLLTLPSPLAGACLTPRPHDLLGRAVARGAPLATVGDTSQMLAVARVEPDATWEARPGAGAILMPDALPGTVLRGRVRDLIPLAGSRQGFRLTVPVANPGALRPGMSAGLKVYGPARSLLGHLREAFLRLLRADLWG